MQIWCDASFDNWTKKAGLAVTIIKLIKPCGVNRNQFEVPTYAADNNEAELLAIKFGIQQAKQYPPEKINIITDSTIAINALKNPKQAPAKYRELVFSIINDLGTNFRIYHRKAHTRRKDKYTKEQALCDIMAKRARNQEIR